MCSGPGGMFIAAVISRMVETLFVYTVLYRCGVGRACLRGTALISSTSACWVLIITCQPSDWPEGHLVSGYGNTKCQRLTSILTHHYDC